MTSDVISDSSYAILIKAGVNGLGKEISLFITALSVTVQLQHSCYEVMYVSA